jgi:hypothetical protein
MCISLSSACRWAKESSYLALRWLVLHCLKAIQDHEAFAFQQRSNNCPMEGSK